MKLSKLVLATAIALPAFAGAQVAPAQAKPDMKATFTVMKANVAMISDAAEKERWTANEDAWDAVVSQSGTIQAADIARINAALATIKANVAKISAAGEKERWRADRDLWQAVIGRVPAK